MSSSSDGRPPAPPRRLPDSRTVDPETRADRRYAVDPHRPPPPPAETWGGPASGRARPTSRQPYDDPDPRTGPPTFEFQPSPLQPRQAPRVSRPQPPPAAGQAHERAGLPQHPEDLYDMAEPPRRGQEAPARNDDLRLEQPSSTGLSAPSRTRRSNRETANAPIVPAGSVTGRSLTLVVAIMCFLACLTAGAVYLMNQSANAWLRDIAAEVTVQVEQRSNVDVERQVREVVAFLGRQPGVTGAKPLSLEVSTGMLAPWLGQSEGLKDLPVPRLIAVQVDRLNPPDFAALRTALTKDYQGVSLDDHRHWQQQIRTVTRSFALGGFAILILVGAATTAIIVSATRSALASNREIVEVLHFVGATDKFIARQFQRHFLSLGIRAGVVGAFLAGLAFLGVPIVMEVLGGGSASAAELQNLVGSGTLDLQGYGWLAAVVVVIASLCMLTSRIGVYRILHSQH